MFVIRQEYHEQPFAIVPTFIDALNAIFEYVWEYNFGEGQILVKETSVEYGHHFFYIEEHPEGLSNDQCSNV